MTLLLFTQASAHTGGISNLQDCTYGTKVTANLDDNVSADRSWSITINGVVVDTGSGPGPKSMGPYLVGGYATGSASLRISVGDKDENTYTTSWQATSPCPKDTPKARLVGPCGDPMYKAVFDNRNGTRSHVFVWRWKSYSTGQWVNTQKTVAAGVKYATGYKHVLGNSRTSIKADGVALLATTMAAPGTYTPCV